MLRHRHFALITVSVSALFGTAVIWATVGAGYIGFNQSTDLIISGIIFIFGLAGFTLGARSANRLDLDLHDCLTLGTRVSKKLKEIHDQNAASIPADRVGFLVSESCRNGSSISVPALRVLAAARDFRRISNTDLSRWIDELVDGSWRQIATLQKQALSLGILGTFVGLVQALWRLSLGNLDEISSGLKNEIFSALHLAFGTSIAGLVVSISLAVILLELTAFRDHFTPKAEECLENLCSLCQHLEIDSLRISAFSDIRERLTDLCAKVSNQSTQLEKQNQAVTEGMATLRGLEGEFANFCRQLHQTQNLALNDARQIFEVFSLEKITTSFDERISKVTENMAKAVEQDLARIRISINQSREAAEGGVQSSTQALQLEGERIAQTATSLAVVYDNIAQTLKELQRQLESVRKAHLEGFFKALDTKMSEVSDHSNQTNYLLRENNRLLEKSLNTPFLKRIFR